MRNANQTENSNIADGNRSLVDESVDKEFLKEVYIQCNNIYLSFVNFRFQILAILISNAALFGFVYEKRQSIKLDFMVSVVAIFTSWIMYFIDKRNKHIFKRVITKAKLIEIYFNVPEDMRIHSKSLTDLKNKISHTILFLVITISTTVFWIIFLGFCIWRY
ncbi:MAG: hypothetical protein HFG17_11450 [Oscillospiraceae bacterium]|nr:hypothetical protein [Oscillospiraceae bacterium]